MASNEAEVDDFLNLAVLYMSCGDFGFTSCHSVAFLLLAQTDPSDENTKGASALLDAHRHRTSERARYVTSVPESALNAP